jgi:DNA-binding FadR family transcriptional regulator
MFEIAALGSHRPRAIEEHGNLCRAIVSQDPDLARAAAQKLVSNASYDIDHILHTVENTRGGRSSPGV